MGFFNNADNAMEPSLYTVKAIVILDNDGNRLLSKYYDASMLQTVKEQKVFEKTLFTRNHHAKSEIISVDGLTCLFHQSIDLFLFVVGSSQENELILLSVLECLKESLNHFLRRNVEKRSLLDNLEIVILMIDEICDGGIILETEARNIIQRVTFRTEDMPLGDQTVAQVYQSAKEQLKWSILK